MADVNAIIRVDIDASAANAGLASMASQMQKFNKGMVAGSAAMNAAQIAAANRAQGALNRTGQWIASTGSMMTAAGRMHKQFDKGTMASWQQWRDTSAKTTKAMGQQAVMTQMAAGRVRALQTQYTALGREVEGTQKYMRAQPTGMLKQWGADAMFAQQKAVLFNRRLQMGANSMINWGKNTQWAGRQMMVGMGIPLGIAAVGAVRSFKDIEQASISFKRVYGDATTSAGEKAKMLGTIQEGVAQDMTKYGIAVSDTLSVAAKAAATGQKGDDLVTATRETMRLATLGQIDYDQALESTIATQTAFGVSSKGMVRVTDFLNAAENQTILSMDDMTKAIPRVAPVIRGLGGDIEDLGVLMTALRAGGVTAEQGANALKSGLGSLINPTSGATAAMEKFGIPLDKIVNANKGDLIGTVQDFGKALNELPKFDQQQALEALFGKYQYARMGALFKNINSKQAKETARLSEESSANLAKMSENELSQISDSALNKFQGAVERLKAAAAPLGEAILNILAPIVDFGANLLGFFNDNSAAAWGAGIALAFAGVAGVVTMLTGVFANFAGTMAKGALAMRSMGRWAMGKPSLRYNSIDDLEASAAQRQLSAGADAATASLYGEKGAVNQLTAALNAMNAELRESVGLQAAAAGGAPIAGGGRTRGAVATTTAAAAADRQTMSQFRSSIAAGADRAHISRPISLLAPENAAALKKIQAAYGPESSVGKAIAAAQASGATIAGKNGRFLAMDTILNNEMDRVGSPGVKGIELANDATTKGGDVYKPFLRQLAYGAGVSASDMVRDPAVQRAVEGFHREYVSTFAGMGENYIKGEGFQSVVEPMMRKHFGSLPGWDATGLVHQISGEGFGKLEVPNSDSAITGWKSESLKKVSESIDMSGYKLSQATDGQIDAVTRSATETEKQATQTSKENTKAQKNLAAAQKAHSDASAKVVEQEKKLAKSSGLLARTKDEERRSARKIEIDGINRELERAKSAEAAASRNLTKATDAVAAENRTRALTLKDGTKASGITAKSGESVPLRSPAGIAPVPTSQSEESKAAARRLKGLPPIVPTSEPLTASQMRANSAMRQRFDQAEQNALSGKGLRAGRMGRALMGSGPSATSGGIWQSMRAGGAFTGETANAWSNKLMGLGMAADMVTMGLMASGKEVPVWTHMVGMGMMTLAMFPDLLLKPASKLGAGMKTAGASLGARVLPALKSVGSKAKVLATGAAMLGTELLGMGKKGQIGAGLKTFAKGFGIVGGAVTALAAVAFFAERQWKASLNSAIEGGNALGAAMSTDATEIQALGQQYGNEKTLAQKYADRRAVTSFSASKAQEEAGKAVSQSGIGQAIMTDVAKVVNEQGLSRGIESLGVKLATATLQGAMSQGDVKGFASALAESNPALASGAMKEYGSLVSQSSLKTDPVGTALKINEANNRMVNSTLDSMMQEQVRTQQQIDEARATNDNGGLSENTNARIGRLGTNANEITQLEMQSKLQEAKYAGLAGTVMGAGLGQQVDNRAAAYMRLLDIKKQLNATDDPRQQATLAQQWDNGTAALQKFDSQQKETLQNAQDAFNSIQGDDARNAMQGSLDNAVRQRYAGDIMAGAIAEGNIQQLWDQGNEEVITREIQFKLTALQASGAINPDALNKMLSTEGGSAKVDLVMGNTSSLNEAGDFFNKLSTLNPAAFSKAIEGAGNGFVKAAKYAGMTRKEALATADALGANKRQLDAINRAYRQGRSQQGLTQKIDRAVGKDGTTKKPKALTQVVNRVIGKDGTIKRPNALKQLVSRILGKDGTVKNPKALDQIINRLLGGRGDELTPAQKEQLINRLLAFRGDEITPRQLEQVINRMLGRRDDEQQPPSKDQTVNRGLGARGDLTQPPTLTQTINRVIKGSGLATFGIGGFDGGVVRLARGGPSNLEPLSRARFLGNVTGPGGPKDDAIPAWLSNGEFVMRQKAVSKYGTGFMHDVNALRLKNGDQVGDSSKGDKSKKSSEDSDKEKDKGWKELNKSIKDLAKTWKITNKNLKNGNALPNLGKVGKGRKKRSVLATPEMMSALLATDSPNALKNFFSRNKKARVLQSKLRKQINYENTKAFYDQYATDSKTIKANSARLKMIKKNGGLATELNAATDEEILAYKSLGFNKKKGRRSRNDWIKTKQKVAAIEYSTWKREQDTAQTYNTIRNNLSKSVGSDAFKMTDEEAKRYAALKGTEKDTFYNKQVKTRIDSEKRNTYFSRLQELADEKAYANRFNNPTITGSGLNESDIANLSQEDFATMLTLTGDELRGFAAAVKAAGIEAENMAMSQSDKNTKLSSALDDYAQTFIDQAEAQGKAAIIGVSGMTQAQLEARNQQDSVTSAGYGQDQTLLQREIDDVNKAYDAQVRILDKVVAAQTALANLERARLGVASALSQGDIAGAAAAAQEARAQQAQFAQEQMRQGLEDEREAKIKERQDRIDELQDKIDDLNDKIFERQQIIDKAMADAGVGGADAAAEVEKQNVALENTQGYWDGIRTKIFESVAGLREMSTLMAMFGRNVPAVSGGTGGGTATTTPTTTITDDTTGDTGESSGTGTKRGNKINAKVSKKLKKINEMEQKAKKAADKSKNKDDDKYFEKKIEPLAKQSDKMGQRVDQLVHKKRWDKANDLIGNITDNKKALKEKVSKIAADDNKKKKKKKANAHSVGGWVPGSGSGDIVPSFLTPGEYVLSKDNIKRGAKFLESMKNPSYTISSQPGMVNAAVQGGGMEYTGDSNTFNVTVNVSGGNLDANSVADIAVRKMKDLSRSDVRKRRV